MASIKRHVPTVLTLFISFVFIQSLFFKFADAPETQHIFNTLNDWVTGLGLPARHPARLRRFLGGGP